MAGLPTDGGEGSSPNYSNGNGLVLYFHPASFYSQKVLLALHEKRLKYKPYIVNIFVGDHLKPWFLKLNSKSQIPVLQDGIKVIPDSSSIIEYLEDNFYNGNFPKLQPPKGSEAFQKVKQYQDLLNEIKVSVLTHGSLIFPELVSDPAISEAERKDRLGYMELEQVILSRQREFPEVKSLLEEKHEVFSAKIRSIHNKDQVLEVMSHTEEVLDQIEKELASHNKDQRHWWLCSEQFTTVDVMLAILVIRFNNIGLSSRFLDVSRRPWLKDYAERLEQRPTFQEFQSEVERFRRQLRSSSFRKPLVTTLSAVSVLGLVALIALLYKRFKKM